MAGMEAAYVPPLGNRLGAGLSYFAFTTIGTVIYGIVIVALIRGRNKLPNYSFYLFVYHFAVADVGVMAFTYYFIAIPLSLAGRPLYGQGLFLKLISFSDSFFYYAISILSFLVSIHRFLVFFSPRLSELLFERPNIYFSLILPWIWGFGIDAAYLFIGNCFKTYNHITFNFEYDCSANTTDAGLFQRQFTPYITSFLPLISLILYLAVYWKMKYVLQNSSQNSQQSVLTMQRNRREKSFLTQALTICLTLLSATALFHLIPYLAAEGIIDYYWVSLLFGWTWIMVTSLNPIIYILFNETIRAVVFEFIGIKQSSTVAPTIYHQSMTTNHQPVATNHR